ncbi:MAG: glycosyltransferase family 2 protein, partial [Selenomonadaceae bacterium]|nr:glycosyltransferase family 2 protein [Selenomonadaceae bacterium]
RNKFLDMYSDFVYPKVLIGITTYNRPEYLQVALKSVMTQTYRNLEIVITDDSTNDETARIMPEYLDKDKRIKYYKQENFTGLDNFTWLIRYIKSSPITYINWLMDDDMLYPTKIEKMMTYYLEYDNIALVTSYRNKIDADGNLLQSEEPRLFEQDVIIPGRDVGCTMLGNCLNFVGEFSTTLLDKNFLREDVLWGWIDSIDWSLGLVDVSTWLQLCTKGDMAYIAEPLSAFRKHENQGQQSEQTIRACMLHWCMLIKFAIDNNAFLVADDEKRGALAQWGKMFHHYLDAKSSVINTDKEYENIIYNLYYKFMGELDMANVQSMRWTGEQIEHAALPIKLKSIKGDGMSGQAANA